MMALQTNAGKVGSLRKISPEIRLEHLTQILLRQRTPIVEIVTAEDVRQFVLKTAFD